MSRILSASFFLLIFCCSNLFSYAFTVKSSEAGSQAFTNGAFAGYTPVTFQSEKDVKLEIKKKGFQTYSGELKSGDGQNRFFRLLPKDSHFKFISQIRCGNCPKDVLFSPDGSYLMIVPMTTDFIQAYSMKDSKMIRITVPKPFGPRTGFVEGVFNEDGSEFWFNQMYENGRVLVLDMKTMTVKTNIPVYANWTKVGEFTPDFQYYYVTGWLSDSVSVIRVKDYQYLTQFKTTSKEPRGVNFSADGKFVYVVTYAGGEILKFSVGENYKLVKRINTGGVNGRFRIDRAKNLAYINNMHKRKVFLYDLNTDKIVGEIDTGSNPNNVRLDPAGRYLYVSNRGPNNPKSYEMRSPVDGKIQIFDTQNGNKLVEELKVGNQPIGIGITPDGKILAISNFMDSTVEFYEIGLNSPPGPLYH